MGIGHCDHCLKSDTKLYNNGTISEKKWRDSDGFIRGRRKKMGPLLSALFARHQSTAETSPKNILLSRFRFPLQINPGLHEKAQCGRQVGMFHFFDHYENDALTLLLQQTVLRQMQFPQTPLRADEILADDHHHLSNTFKWNVFTPIDGGNCNHQLVSFSVELFTFRLLAILCIMHSLMTVPAVKSRS